MRRTGKYRVTDRYMGTDSQSSTAVEQRGDFEAHGMAEGNENRRWHGTVRACRLGEKGHSQLCSEHNCSLCRIIEGSFSLDVARKANNWQRCAAAHPFFESCPHRRSRFGLGHYFTATSSKYVNILKDVRTLTVWKSG